MSKREKLPQHVTPKGVVKYSYLNKPNTKFNPDGDWSVDITLEKDSPECDALIDKLDKLGAEAFASLASKDAKVKKYDRQVNYSDDFDKVKDADGEETEVENGKVKFNFKNKAIVRPKGKDSFETKVAIYDAKGKPFLGAKIGRDSVVKVCFEATPFAMASTRKAGVSLRLKAVQVLEYKPFNGEQSADAFGFGEEEGFSNDADVEAFGEEAEGTDSEAPTTEKPKSGKTF